MYELWPPTKKRPNGERPHGEVVPETAHTQRERGEKEEKQGRGEGDRDSLSYPSILAKANTPGDLNAKCSYKNVC